jgi:hypothetical protein
MVVMRILLQPTSLVGVAAMNIKSMRARTERLSKISKGLIQEERLWADPDLAVLYVERLEYRKAITDAIHGLEAARVTLVKVVDRLEKEAMKRQ